MARIASVVAILIMAGCQEEEFVMVDADGFDALERGSRAALRIVHLSPDAPDVDATATGGSGGEFGLPYEAATGVKLVPPDTYELNLWVAGTQTLALQANVTLPALSNTTILAFDEVANLQPALLDIDLANIPSGSNRIQVFHSAVGAGTVDVWELQLGAKLIDDFAFGSQAQLDVAQGPLELALDLSPNDGVPDFTFSVPDVGSDQFINVFPVIDGSGVALLALFPDSSIVRIPAN